MTPTVLPLMLAHDPIRPNIIKENTVNIIVLVIVVLLILVLVGAV